MGNWNSSDNYDDDDAGTFGADEIGGGRSGGGSDDNSGNRQAYTDRFGGTSTRNFNVNTSQSSVTKDGTTTYGTRAQLDDLFGPSQVDTTVPGTGFSFGGGRTTMAQMAGYTGQMSPTTVGGYGISAGRGSVTAFGDMYGGGRFGYETTRVDPETGNVVPARQLGAFDRFVGTPDPTLGWTGGTAGVGTGLSKPTVVDIDMATGRIRSVTPGTVGLMEGQYVTDRTEMTTEQVSTMAAAMGYDYAGQMVDPALAGVTVGGPLGVDPSKAGYVGYGTDTGMNFARVTGEEKVAEGFIGGMGLAGAALVGLDPEFAEVTELGTGRVGTYTDVGGIAGLLGKGTYVSFADGSTPPDTGGGDDDGVNPLLYRSRVPTPTPRFRSRQQFSPIRSMRFPSAPRPSYGRGPTAYAAEGGYIQGTNYLQAGLEQKKPGFHAMQFGGKVYAVSPDEKDPTQFRAYGGTMPEVRAAFGGAFGYDPSTIDFTKKPGEPGFGTDLKGFVPGVGGLNSQNQFVTANGTFAQNSADPFLEKYRAQMKIGGLAGFVGARPEQLDPQQTVEDSVPVDVPEGTFVLNGPATEYAGSKDVEEMLNKATQYAQEAGIDIEKENARIASKGLVKLAVSPGEVLIDPIRASIIGLDTLNKMNNRGKKEVARRQQEQQSKESPQEQQMSELTGPAVS